LLEFSLTLGKSKELLSDIPCISEIRLYSISQEHMQSIFCTLHKENGTKEMPWLPTPYLTLRYKVSHYLLAVLLSQFDTMDVSLRQFSSYAFCSTKLSS
jgi:hypothetical protein